MSYTIKYLKYIVVVILAIIMVFSLVGGAVLTGVGILGPAVEMNVMYLIFIPVGLFLGFTGFVALDTFKYLLDKWGLTK